MLEMKNEILRENLSYLIKSYGFDATYNLCFQLEADNNNNISNYLPTLLSLSTQYYHRCRWIYDVQSNTTTDTWASVLANQKSKNEPYEDS
jgi:hypothetical protein